MWYFCTIAVNASFDHTPWDEVTNLGCGLQLERIPDWVKEDEALSLLSWRDREQIRDAEWSIATEYEADALGSPDPEWKGKEPRGIQSSVDEKFTLISVALWLVKPSPLTCGPLLHFGEKSDPASFRQSASLRPVLIREDENDNVPSQDDLTAAGEILKAILSLRRDATCWIAIRMLVRAVTEAMWEGRYLWQWIVLEALFGADSPNETTHRLAQRITLFTESERERRKQIFRSVKEAYGWRSKLVHGRKLSKLTPEKSRELTIFTEDLIRKAFMMILKNPENTQQFNSKSRNEFLENLAFP